MDAASSALRRGALAVDSTVSVCPYIHIHTHTHKFTQLTSDSTVSVCPYIHIHTQGLKLRDWGLGIRFRVYICRSWRHDLRLEWGCDLWVRRAGARCKVET